MNGDTLYDRLRKIEDELLHIKTSQKMNSDIFKFYTYSAIIPPLPDGQYNLKSRVVFTPNDASKDYIVTLFDSTYPTFGLVGEDTFLQQNNWLIARLPGDNSKPIVIISTTPGIVTVNN